MRTKQEALDSIHGPEGEHVVHETREHVLYRLYSVWLWSVKQEEKHGVPLRPGFMGS